MEVNFDKEIDALLRDARPNKGVLVGDDPAKPTEPSKPKHLDADAIAAFAENSLPGKTRMSYIEHFADCDHCRTLLSRAVQLNMDALSAADSSAVALSSPVGETVAPWYQRIFRMPNLAVAMGALILAFSGILGLLVLQNQNKEANSKVAQIAEQDRQDRPYAAGDAPKPTPSAVPGMLSNANTSANSASNSMAAAPNNLQAEKLSLPADSSGMIPPSNTRSGQYQLDGASAAEKTAAKDQSMKPAAPPAKSAPAAPPSTTTDVTGAEADTTINSQTTELLPKGVNMSPMLRSDKPTRGVDEKKKSVKAEGKDANDLAKNRQAEDRSRDLPGAAAKSARGAAMLNQSLPINGRNPADMSVTRVVGGKTFSSRAGAWYDSSYHGQPTTSYRRGTDEYKQLDKGLRNIAENLGGTVVIIWKGKAYRIQ
jgi:hypothetical protein